jgi:FkbM family methyltransferase
MELGAGWGTWLVAGAVAARNRGIPDLSLLGVEADPGHFGFLRQHFIDNGLDPDEHLLFQAAVGAKAGHALWPRVIAKDDWGSRPIYEDETRGAELNGSVSDHLGRKFTDFMKVPVLAIDDLLLLQDRWDLMHVDVQGGEVSICEAGLALMNERVHWLIIGTHARTIEGQLISILVGSAWVLENEKPARFNFVTDAPSHESMTTHDGTQVWRNPRRD